MNDIANPLFRGVSDAEWKEMEEMNCLWEHRVSEESSESVRWEM